VGKALAALFTALGKPFWNDSCLETINRPLERRLFVHPNTAVRIAASLPLAERVLLFCIAAGIDWQEARIPEDAVQALMMKGLIEQNATGKLTCTGDGRAVLAALSRR
jgi:hypothetical protein